jgi:hypothetical protein
MESTIYSSKGKALKCGLEIQMSISYPVVDCIIWPIITENF